LALRRRGDYFAYRAGSALACAVPRLVAVAAARGLGLTFAAGMRGRRRMVARHLRRVHGPGMSEWELQREVRRAFDSYGRYWMELFRTPTLSPEEVEAGLTVEGLEHLEAATAGGRGVIMALPHLGGWEFASLWMGLHGYRATVVAEPVEPPELFEWFTARRRDLGLTVVPLGPQAGTATLRAVRAGEVVGLICDRDIGGGGIEVEFFGERTTLPGGPATLALRTGAAILPTAVYFDGPNGHHAVVRRPLPVERSGRIREDVTRVTQAIAAELEVLIRRAPDQWHLFQPNWPSDREERP
jgi:lauroyl/myristoyl acyltransferase